MSHNAYNVSKTAITAILGGVMYTVPNDHPNYSRIMAALKARKFNEVPDLADLRTAVRKFLSADKQFSLGLNDCVTYNGVAYPQVVSDKVMKMIDAGNAPEPIFKFLRNVESNPSFTARKELFLFVAANNFMLDEEGFILAYKSVSDTYHDIHSRTVFYKPAGLMTPAERKQYAKGVTMGVEKNVSVKVTDGVLTVSMPRNAVDDVRDRTCSNGLHFAAHEYAKSFGYGNGHMLLLRVNPADVVSIPSDYHNQKGRTCSFEVIGEISNASQLPSRTITTHKDLTTDSNLKAVKKSATKTSSKDAPTTKAEANKAVARKVAIRANVSAKLSAVNVNIAKLQRSKKGWKHLSSERLSLIGKKQALDNEIADLRSKFGV